MASVNKVILVGNLGAIRKCGTPQSGDAMCNLSLATTDTWRDKATGERKERRNGTASPFSASRPNRGANICARVRRFMFGGSLRTRKWTDKDGQEALHHPNSWRCDADVGGRQGAGAPAGSGRWCPMGGGMGGGSMGGYYNGPVDYAPAPQKSSQAFV